MKKAKDGTGRGNPEIYKYSNNNLTTANKVRNLSADKFAIVLYPYIKDERDEGRSLSGIADTFNADEIPTPSGKGKWTAKTVSRVIERYLNISQTK